MLPLLEGVRVLDFCRLIPGDLATVKLADLGADVIKVEHPKRFDYMRDMLPLVEGVGLFYLVLNRNKRSIELDYDTPEGREVLDALLRSADVLVEVSRPGARVAEGLDYETVSAVNPGLIYCSVTGYGQTGPYRDFPSHGWNIDGAAGVVQVEPRMASSNGEPSVELPELQWLSIDGVGPGTNAVTLGGMEAALAVAAALVQRGRTGRGQYLDISCWDSAVAAVGTAFDVAHMKNLGRRYPQDHPLGSKYNCYAAADGLNLMIAVMEPWFWDRFCRAVGKEEWIEKWSQTVGWRHDAAAIDPDESVLRTEIGRVLLERPRHEWLSTFATFGVPVSAVDTLEDVLAGPQTADRKMLVKTSHPGYGEVSFVSQPIKTSAGDFDIRLPPPCLGENTREVLESIGYGAGQIDALERGIAKETNHEE